jgi:cytochrome bd-type quinol oxidase subunit 2
MDLTAPILSRVKFPLHDFDEAATPRSSLAFMFWDEDLFVFRLTLLYTSIIYRVFRGKVRPTANRY